MREVVKEIGTLNETMQMTFTETTVSPTPGKTRVYDQHLDYFIL